jgi:hypothetical protein
MCEAPNSEHEDETKHKQARRTSTRKTGRLPEAGSCPSRTTARGHGKAEPPRRGAGHGAHGYRT